MNYQENISTNLNIPPSYLLKKAATVVLLPIMVLIISTLFYMSYRYYFFPQIGTKYAQQIISAAYLGLQVIATFISYWIFARLMTIFSHYLLTSPIGLQNKTFALIIPFFNSVLKTITFLALLDFLVPQLGLPQRFTFFIEKLSSIFIIISIAWVLLRLTHLFEQIVVSNYSVKVSNDVIARKIYTQTLILKRIVIGIILILTFGSILMLFENVRSLGASVLTTAGLAGLVLTLAAQRSLPNIFAGVEIALTQPIKIGDSVVIENETGKIEEITFRYVVVKLWDWRRLVVPTTYFLEKPFQNLSREQSNNLIGTVYLYVDYTLPVSVIREEFLGILKNSSLWDGDVANIQVSDAKERTMELRIIASAKSSSATWDLRCEIREKLIDFLVKKFPQCFPVDRTTSISTHN